MSSCWRSSPACWRVAVGARHGLPASHHNEGTNIPIQSLQQTITILQSSHPTCGLY
ncbi:hypothetical protein HCBG_02628 [Histoplasma capsulatum G186AR]|uniref:Uncharacterized protein n=1 Tax=Ajellomyces capsulatus (strain G186AR / H82 / ATCC MYA-2454 / RMSCC 2432) TaxID=447093 RepID=C0NH06_AJECG|nr:uncharacterized protein HCBG_02628 [Histoplasma capsulatum G186AR]EEH09091.1 hypothetical protein HCBG_02628 [Histoplasma capsulatum G186AR]